PLYSADGVQGGAACGVRSRDRIDAAAARACPRRAPRLETARKILQPGRSLRAYRQSVDLDEPDPRIDRTRSGVGRRRAAVFSGIAERGAAAPRRQRKERAGNARRTD